MTTVRINLRVPRPERPGCPFLVFFGNGDWEFCTFHDVEFLGDYMGALPVVEVLNVIALECLDEDEMDECEGESLLVQSFEVEESTDDETVLALLYTGGFSLELRGRMHNLIGNCSKPHFNFIALPEFFDDLKYWIKHNRKRMEEVEAEHPRDLTDLME